MELQSGGNLFWINLNTLTSPGVPINPSSVAQLKTRFFSEPGTFPADIVVAIPDLAFDPMVQCGALQCISPDELKMAFISAVADRVSGGADAEELTAWKHMALTVTMHFRWLETEDKVYFAALNMRQDIVVKFETLARTAYQWVFEVIAFRQRKLKELGGENKTLHHKTLCELFNENTQTTERQEEVNEEFVKACVAVYDKILRHPLAQDIVLWFEHTYGQLSPLDSVYKMHRIAKKAKPADVPWVFACMKDKLESKAMGPRDFPERILTGSAEGGGRGLVDLFALKSDMRSFLLNSEGQRLGIDGAALAEMNRCFADFQVYREQVTPINGDASSMDRSYQSGWARSTVRCMGFVEEVVFGESYDGYLKTGCRAGKSPTDILEYPSLKQQVESIASMIEKEQATKLAAQSPTKATGSDGEAEGNATADGQGDVPAGGSSGADRPSTSEAEREITRLVHSYCKIVVEPDSQSELKRLLQSSAVGKMLGMQHKHYILIVFDVKFCGEADTKPHARIPPWPQSRAKKVIHAVLESRATMAGYSATQLVPGDVFLIADGGKHGNGHKIKNLFKDENGANFKNHASIVKVIKSESGITDRITGTKRGVCNIVQDEHYFTIASEKMKLPVMRRKHFAGTHREHHRRRPRLEQG